MNPEHTNSNSAEILLSIGAVAINLKNPFRFTSGIYSPIYIDNRTLLSHPQSWISILEAIQNSLSSKRIVFDIIAGIESAGIPHSTGLCFLSGKPSVYVRKMKRDHGKEKMIEGGVVEGKIVLIIEDHVSTGGSVLSAVDQIRNNGGVVNDCFSITSYDFPISKQNFFKKDVNLHTLVGLSQILESAIGMGILSAEDENEILRWHQSAKDWSPPALK